MREDGVDQLFLGGLEPHGNDEALNQFRDLRAYHVGPKQFTGLGIEDRLDETLILTQRNGLAIGQEREAADLNLSTLLPLPWLRSGRRRLPAGGSRCNPVTCSCPSDAHRGPLIFSTQITPSCSALCASIGGT